MPCDVAVRYFEVADPLKLHVFTVRQEIFDLPKEFPLDIFIVEASPEDFVSHEIFHCHDCIEIAYMKAGHGCYYTMSQLIPVEAGDVMVFSSMQKHGWEGYPPDRIVQPVIVFDHSVFHLDGYGATRHLDDLLAIPELNAIQWVPGDGAEPMPYWIPLLKRIQAGKKSIHISTRPEDVEILLENLNPEGLMINTYARSIEEAGYLVDMAAKLSARKVW